MDETTLNLLIDARDAILSSDTAVEVLEDMAKVSESIALAVPGVGYVRARNQEVLRKLNQVLCQPSTKDEIERRWLVAPEHIIVDWRTVCPIINQYAIVQAYLDHPDGDEGVVERVRRSDGPNGKVFTHTVKWPTGNVGHRREQESIVSEEQYHRLLKRESGDYGVIYKVRWVFDYKGWTWEFDQFTSPGRATVLEVELPSLDTEVELPPWIPIVREITDEVRWTNAMIARHGFPE